MGPLALPMGPLAPLLSAAPRHQVDGLFQFVPQLVFATVAVTVQSRQDLRRTTTRSEVTITPTSDRVSITITQKLDYLMS